MDVNLEKIALTAAIAVMYTLFVAYGITVLYGGPAETEEAIQYHYARNCFFLLLLTCIVTIFISTRFVQTESISSGLVVGSVLIFIFDLIYTSRFWFMFSRFIKWLGIGAILALLIHSASKQGKKKLLQKKSHHL